MLMLRRPPLWRAQPAASASLFQPTDVSRQVDCVDLVDVATSRFGGLDAVVNAAAVGKFDVAVADISEEDWDRVLGINLKGTFLMCKAAILLLQRRGG
jgi:NAD(P)-dependent dehydrogenase (short-subunit alcohol dehydrogenase family)